MRITGDGLNADHLDYGYARTVHRAQGATVDRAHGLAAGGGRELAYVALSRARGQTHIYATADSLEQAVDDLRAAWSDETHQRWIADTRAAPGEHPEPVRAVPERPAAGQRALSWLAPAQRLLALTDDYHDLQAGTGHWTHTPEGAAAQARSHARTQLEDAQRRAQNPSLRRRERRRATKSLVALVSALDQAEQSWQELGEPIAHRLRDQIIATRREIEHVRITETRERLDRCLTSRPPEPTLDRDLGIGF